MQQRTRKCSTTFHALARWWRSDGLRRVVIDCPISGIGVWIKQARIHLNIAYSISVVRKAGKVEQIIDGGDHALHFLLVNYEVTWRERYAAAIIEFRPEAFIVDEGHRIKSHKSRQSLAAYELAEECECDIRIDLTGTPTDTDEVDLWAQFRFLNPKLLGHDWKKFERRWLRRAGYGHFKRQLKRHLRPKFLNLIAPYVFEISRKEALGLPELEEFEIPFDLTGEAARVYQEIEDDLYSEIKGEVVATPMRVTQLIRLQQITGGFLNTDDAKIILNQDKLSILNDWLDDYLHSKVVIFARFTDEIDALNSVLAKKFSVGVLDGRSKDRLIWQKFQARPDPQMIIVQEQTGGESIELSVADVGVSYSKSHSWLKFDQCRSRLIGKRKNILFAHMIAENTIDTDLMGVVSKKGSSQTALLHELRKRRLGYGKGKG